jgi:hypothetical protein
MQRNSTPYVIVYRPDKTQPDNYLVSGRSTLCLSHGRFFLDASPVCSLPNSLRPSSEFDSHSLSHICTPR